MHLKKIYYETYNFIYLLLFSIGHNTPIYPIFNCCLRIISNDSISPLEINLDVRPVEKSFHVTNTHTFRIYENDDIDRAVSLGSYLLRLSTSSNAMYVPTYICTSSRAYLRSMTVRYVVDSGFSITC